MSNLIRKIKKKIKHLIKKKVAYGFKSSSAYLSSNAIVFNPQKLFLYDNASIKEESVILNARANFIMKKNSHAAMGLRVFPGNHMRIPGRWYIDVKDSDKDMLDTRKEFDQDIVVEEDVWIGAYVTLLNGSHVGRGCVVGSGTVVRGNLPPYSIVIGNPAKVVGFVFTPEEISLHEEMLYAVEERIDPEIIKKNYEKYFLKRLKLIHDYSKL